MQGHVLCAVSNSESAMCTLNCRLPWQRSDIGASTALCTSLGRRAGLGNAAGRMHRYGPLHLHITCACCMSLSSQQVAQIHEEPALSYFSICHAKLCSVQGKCSCFKRVACCTTHNAFYPSPLLIGTIRQGLQAQCSSESSQLNPLHPIIAHPRFEPHGCMSVVLPQNGTSL